MSLEALLASRLMQGPLPAAEVMALALYHPEHGYYRRAAGPWGFEGKDYYTALDVGPLLGQALARRLEAAWERLPARYDARFRRMWQFYLAASMASFRVRRNQLWQLLLSPRALPPSVARMLPEAAVQAMTAPALSLMESRVLLLPLVWSRLALVPVEAL